MSNRKPFILNKHEQVHPKMKELKDEELGQVSGSGGQPPKGPGDEVETITVTPDGDGGDDGMDEI